LSGFLQALNFGSDFTYPYVWFTYSIVFIDEIDKIVGGGSRQAGSGVSSEGVQRDLLPIIEGDKLSSCVCVSQVE